MKKEIIPRPIKACLLALAAILLAVTYYIALGCPTLTLRQELRRAEKVHLVGPCKIVDRISGKQYAEFKKMLVGETEHGITFFGRCAYNECVCPFPFRQHYKFSYQEKTGDVTFAAPPNILGSREMTALPVYVFTEHEDAVRAKISIQAEGSRFHTQNGASVEKLFAVTFRAEADRDKNGFFRFLLTAPENHATDPTGEYNYESYVLYCISSLCDWATDFRYLPTLSIPVTVTLYDADGNEIVTRELQLGPAEQEKN